MKKLEELKISPVPWSFIYDADDWKTIYGIQSELDKNKHRDIVAWNDSPMKESDANLMLAAPKLYGKAYEVAENLLVHLAMPSQTISMNRAEVAAMVEDLQSALAEAAGEEVRGGCND